MASTKPTNILTAPTGFWSLRDDRGEFYAYSTTEKGVCCTDDIRLARKYSTKRGALSARSQIRIAYGKATKPIYFTTALTYHEATTIPK
jgi:hypothetical protein